MLVPFVLVGVALAGEPLESPVEPAAGAVWEEMNERIETTLDNGLRVTIIGDPSLASASVVDAFDFGSSAEADEEIGVAHAVEHLLFAGTDAHPDRTWWDAVDALGAEINAWTSHDETVYAIAVPPSGLLEVMKLDAERFRSPLLTQEHLELERGVLMDEERLRNGLEPDERVSVKLTSKVLRRHPYGLSVSGRPKDISALELPQVRGFFERHYVAGNHTLVVVSPLDPTEVLEVVQAEYATLPGGESTVQVRRVDHAYAPQTVAVWDAGYRTSMVGVSWALPPGRSCADSGDMSCDEHYWADRVLLELLESEGTHVIATEMSKRCMSWQPVFIDSWQGRAGGLLTLLTYDRPAGRQFTRGVKFFFAYGGPGLNANHESMPTPELLHTVIRDVGGDWIDEEGIAAVRGRLVAAEIARSYFSLPRAMVLADPESEGGATLSTRLTRLQNVDVEQVRRQYGTLISSKKGTHVRIR